MLALANMVIDLCGMPAFCKLAEVFLKCCAGKIDPSFVISHTLPLREAPRGYQIFNDKKENCIKVVLKPGKV